MHWFVLDCSTSVAAIIGSATSCVATLPWPGVRPRSEPLYLLPGASRSPGYTFLNSDEDGQPLVLDVTVTSPLAVTTLQHAAIMAGSVAAAAERR
jgi:hypothetical protein